MISASSSFMSSRGQAEGVSRLPSDGSSSRHLNPTLAFAGPSGSATTVCCRPNLAPRSRSSVMISQSIPWAHRDRPDRPGTAPRWVPVDRSATRPDPLDRPDDPPLAPGPATAPAVEPGPLGALIPNAAEPGPPAPAAGPPGDGLRRPRTRSTPPPAADPDPERLRSPVLDPETRWADFGRDPRPERLRWMPRAQVQTVT